MRLQFPSSSSIESTTRPWTDSNRRTSKDLFFERVLVCSSMTSVMQVLRRATTKHFVVRLDEGSAGTPGTTAGRRGEDTIECWRTRGRDAVRLFLYRDHPRSLTYDGNSDLTRHSVPVDLYRVSAQLFLDRDIVISRWSIIFSFLKKY